jgi:hypothetical protein
MAQEMSGQEERLSIYYNKNYMRQLKVKAMKKKIQHTDKKFTLLRWYHLLFSETGVK